MHQTDSKAQEEGTHGKIALVPLNTWQAKEMSYPTMGGARKQLQHPDMHILARLAEEAGIDLRIILLTRDANDIAVSTTQHREFGSFNDQIEILTDNAAALTSQIHLIDPAFVMCLRYLNLGDAEWWKATFKAS